MKTRLLAFALLLSTFAAKAQYVTIPDANFVAWLNNNGFSQCMNGNQMDTSCPAVIYDTAIVCSYANIRNLNGIQYFDSLRLLNCSHNKLDTFPKLKSTVRKLDCSYNSLTRIDSLPKKLLRFYCDSNSLNFLPPLPDSLKILRCSYNKIFNLPTLPVTIDSIYCYKNFIYKLVGLPANLRAIECSYNRLDSVGVLPDSLKTIEMRYNNIPAIINLPTGLKRFDIYSNLVDSIPDLPNGLEYLDCSMNRIDALPSLNDSLLYLRCSVNNLIAIPRLPSKLKDLYCAQNQLTQLPILPFGLVKLYCNKNQITHLPPLPQSLRFITCGEDSFLVDIGTLPDTLTNLELQRSYALHCLPWLTNISLLHFTDSGVECIPNYGNGTSIPPYNHIGVCGVLNNPYNCTSGHKKIKGKIYVDSNDNCVIDTNEQLVSGVRCRLWSQNHLVEETISSSKGEYSFSIPSDQAYTVSIDTFLPFDVSCPSQGFYYNMIQSSDFSTHYNNFGLTCKYGFDLAATSVGVDQVFRPANNTNVNIHVGDLANYYNASCTQGITGIVTITIAGPAAYVSPASGAITPSNVTDNVITYNVTDFGAADGLQDFNIIVQTDTTAQAGQQVCFIVNVTPTSGDRNSANNILRYCFDIVNSYDPNDKTAYPSANIDTTQDWLTYVIRFQNTGTADAQRIHIADTLSAYIDATSLTLLGYSYEPQIRVIGQTVKFIFDGINLPDSTTDEPGSHGYVQYKVKLKENLPIGTIIENTAFIYFDFNPPVVTNTATNTITEAQDTTGVGIKPVAKAFDMSIYPNPANQQVTVRVSQGGHTIYMYSAQGQLLSSHTMTGTAETLNIAELPSGIYYIEVAGKAGIARKKLVKL